ncbi:MAG: hotdog domain-containing protein [Pseudomonadota bacterium]
MRPDQDVDADPRPSGWHALQTVALPGDTNQHGLIHGGWLVGHMDMAGNLACTRETRGKVATVAIETIAFLSPIQVGQAVGCFTRILALGRSSVRVEVDAWVRNLDKEADWVKVAEGLFVFVAIDDNGRTRAIVKS